MAKFIDSVTDGIRGVNQGINNVIDGKTPSRPLTRSSKLAHRTFELDQPYLNENTPILGFQYFVNVKYNNELEDFIKDFLTEAEREKIPGYVKSIKLPDVSIDTNVYQEYNRRRLVQTKANPSSVDITFHDLVNGNTMKLWQMYYQYYFKDGNFGKSDYVKNMSTGDEDFQYGNFGYNIERVNNTRQFIKEIEIYQVASGYYNKITMFNPVITDFSHDVMSYEKNDLVEVSYSFDCEWIHYEFITMGETWWENNSVPENQQLFDYFERSDVLDFVEWSAGALEPRKLSLKDRVMQAPGISAAVDTYQSTTQAVDAAKGIGRNLAGRLGQAKSFANKFEVEVLGREQPRNNWPDGRSFATEVEDVPDSFSDAGRVIRKNRGGTPFSNDNNDGQQQWPGNTNPSRPDSRTPSTNETPTTPNFPNIPSDGEQL